MTKIIDIVKNNDLEGLKNNLKFYDVNTKDEFNNSLLHLAIYKSSLEMVNFLTENYANINAQDLKLNTPLHLAIIQNKLGIFKYLLRHGADTRIKNEDGETAFMLSLKLNREEFIPILLSLNPNLEDKNTKEENALFYLVRNNNLEVLEDFINKDKKLLKSLNYMNDTLLHEAIKRGSKDVAKFLLDKGIPANVRNKDLDTPLFNAARTGNLELASLLIDYGAIIDCKNRYFETIYDISTERFKDFVEFKENGVKYSNYVKKYPLHVAVIKNDKDLVINHLDKVEAHRKDSNNLKAIDYANLYGYTELINILKPYSN